MRVVDRRIARRGKAIGRSRLTREIPIPAGSSSVTGRASTAARGASVPLLDVPDPPSTASCPARDPLLSSLWGPSPRRATWESTRSPLGGPPDSGPVGAIPTEDDSTRRTGGTGGRREEG